VDIAPYTSVGMVLITDIVDYAIMRNGAMWTSPPVGMVLITDIVDCAITRNGAMWTSPPTRVLVWY
jgi:hypothetical protein